MIETALSLYVLTKRVAYLRAFVEYLRCKFKKRNFVRPKWDTSDLIKSWVALYLPTLQERNKWREIARNLQVGELVLVGDAEDVAVRGKYWVGRIAEVFSQMHQGKLLVRRAKIALTDMTQKMIYIK